MGSLHDTEQQAWRRLAAVAGVWAMVLPVVLGLGLAHASAQTQPNGFVSVLFEICTRNGLADTGDLDGESLPTLPCPDCLAGHLAKILPPTHTGVVAPVRHGVACAYRTASVDGIVPKPLLTALNPRAPPV